MPNINTFAPNTGRVIQEDADVVNIADVIYNSEGKPLFSKDNPGTVDSNFDGGVATGGSNTTIIDTLKNFEVNMFAGNTVKVRVGDIDYYRAVISNSIDTLTISELPGTAASAIIGDLGTAEVTIIVAAKGVGGNEYSVEVVEAPGGR